MRRVLYFIGRIFQLMGMIALPTAMWVTHFERDESSALAIFFAAILIFFLGHIMTRISLR